jgi:hypothetical protein
MWRKLSNVLFQHDSTAITQLSQRRYGFVNFRSLRELELFARHRLGQKWNLFMSEKVLQASPRDRF